MNMSISEIKGKALKSLRGKWGLAVGLTLLIFIINSIFPLIIEAIISGGFTNWVNQEGTSVGGSFFSMILSIALIPFTIAVSWFFLGVARFEEVQITDVFMIYKDGKRALKLIGTSILVGIFTFLWSLLLIIPGIIKSLSYSQTFLLLKDHPELTALDAISESRRRMNGYKWKYFLLNLSFIGWGILCIFTLGIGLLWLSPYVSTSVATFYNELIKPQGNVTKIIEE
ncbi:DUF975 family protein [Bacillus sp. CGMCC 1.16607]|uniref:DUF975 family protein n=1 Tax=Bacillus sp. CGMCC 1.16607 TaxID=3351842 RepID=UPI00363CB7DF